MRSKRPGSALRQFLNSEAAGGIILMAAAVAALIVANSALAPVYDAVLKSYVAGLSVLHWINDALMAMFFLLVALEIKRELLDGHLSTSSRRILPGLAAAGGMIGPALIYLGLNSDSPDTLRGWAIPTATDIAFALGVLSLLGSRVPVSLKVFLTALAILDDLGAIAVIAAFYTAEISPLWLALSGLMIVLLAGVNWAGLERLVLYLLLGAVLWFVVFKSGVHATLAGVALAFAIPVHRSPGHPDAAASPLHRLEHALHPWVTFLVVPLFGLANAGVPLGNLTALATPVPLAIAAGLFFGKQIGVFLSVWTAVKMRWARRPDGASFAQIYGVSLICGIGFTMSLFIGLLAFPSSPVLQEAVKKGVLLGSIVSGIVGAAVLMISAPQRPQRHDP